VPSLPLCRAVDLWNEKVAEITGYSKEEAFGRSLVDSFVVPDLRDSFRAIFNDAREGRGTFNFELRLLAKSSDEVRHLLFTATTRRDVNGNIVGVVGRAQDVTERDKAIAGIALELKQLIDTANAPIFGIDVEGYVIAPRVILLIPQLVAHRLSLFPMQNSNVNEWNRRTQDMTGYTKAEALGKPLVESFIAQPTQQKVQEILDDALKGNETSNYELEFRTKTGESRFIVVNATTRRDLESNVVGGKIVV